LKFSTNCDILQQRLFFAAQVHLNTRRKYYMTDNNVLNLPLVLAFLFFVGALIGWGLEFCFRNLISHNGPRGKYFINPGFCHGPYLPIYGIGLSVMFVIAYTIQTVFDNPSDIVVIVLIGVAMTLIEFIGGLFLLKVLNMRLWDYRKQFGNIMGLICPTFTVIWAVIGAGYYLFIHDIAIGWLIWLSYNLPFSFFVGLFFGVFIIDLVQSGYEAKAIRDYGNDNNVVIKYEELKQAILERDRELGKKVGFFNQTAKNVGIASDIDQVSSDVTVDKKEASKSIKK